MLFPLKAYSYFINCSVNYTLLFSYCSACLSVCISLDQRYVTWPVPLMLYVSEHHDARKSHHSSSSGLVECAGNYKFEIMCYNVPSCVIVTARVSSTLMCQHCIKNSQLKTPIHHTRYSRTADRLWRHHRTVCRVWYECSIRYPFPAQENVQKWSKIFVSCHSNCMLFMYLFIYLFIYLSISDFRSTLPDSKDLIVYKAFCW